ncbi:MAG TPA: peroxidase-related enzyme [Amnibacterium sp.]|jgi:uncharacterized peroxidase-related enzyme|uniref:carboxymuconolactone decarboxylase family protein n=1 Tax=Amnibacterium sp. TaxID=1872496 RepID=UPI002F91E3C1
MSILRTVDESAATGDVAALYEEEIEAQGYVPSHTKVMALNPEAARAWQSLAQSLARPMGKRRWELVTLAAARALRSQHCLLAHGRRTMLLLPEEQLLRLAEDYRDADLTEAEVAMMAFAEKVSTASHAMTDDDSLRLREVGFSDREIVDIALAAAARNYYSRAIQALAVDVDVPPDLPDPLREALLRPLGAQA